MPRSPACLRAPRQGVEWIDSPDARIPRGAVATPRGDWVLPNGRRLRLTAAAELEMEAAERAREGGLQAVAALALRAAAKSLREAGMTDVDRDIRLWS
jgi:hypothetical protein